MSVKPVLFNTEMVKALLAGRKTCTRRVIKRDKVDDVLNSPARKKNPDILDKQFIKYLVNMPYESGNILYVRETWGWCPCWDCGMDAVPGGCKHEKDRFYNGSKNEYGCYVYKASYKDNEYPSAEMWHPSIHMPKKAARIWLKVTDVRVERLQEITEDGAKEEGAIDNRSFIHSPDNEYNYIHTAKEHFIDIWNSTIKKTDIDTYGWDANPWVWVIEFERCEKPLECILNGYDKAPDDGSGRCLGYMYDDNSDTLLPMCEECPCQAKNCSMHEQCICEASADECEIRKQSYNKAIDDFYINIIEALKK